MIIFCDIDGILADCSHRLPFLENKDYDRFYSPKEIMEDTPIWAGLEFAEALMNSEFSEFGFLTGRPYRTEEATRKWIAKNHYYELSKVPMFMRHDHDYRKSEIIKAEIMKKYIEHEKPEDTIIFIDDDPLNVAGVCKELPQVKGLVFGAERLDRVLSDRFKEVMEK